MFSKNAKLFLFFILDANDVQISPLSTISLALNFQKCDVIWTHKTDTLIDTTSNIRWGLHTIDTSNSLKISSRHNKQEYA